MKQKKIKFLNLLLMFALVPTLVAVILAVFISATELRSNMEKDINEKLKVTAETLAAYYEWDIIHEGAPAYEHDYVDLLKGEDIDMTLFEEDTRFITSLLNDKGERNEGTTCDAQVWATVKGGKDFSSDDVVINGVDYYVYYVPVYGDEAETTVWGMAFAGTPRADVSAAVTKVIMTLVIISIIVIAVIAAIAIFLSFKFRKPMLDTVEIVSKLAGGNISDDIELESQISELDAIADCIKELQAALKSSIGGVKSTGLDLGASAENVENLASSSNDGATQISHAVSELALGAQQLAEAVEDVNSMVIEMGTDIADITTSVGNLSAASASIQNANNEATANMNSVSESSDKSVAATEAISKQISQTNGAIQNIGKAVDLILGISAQTSLLALNASIEAARAGEAGRGFAVVAEEISNLAQNSTDGANEIRTLANSMLEMSSETVKQASEISKIIESEKAAIESTQEKFNILSTEVEKSLQEIEIIKEKTETLESVKESITSSVSDLSAISEENAASNEEVTASIENISAAVNETKEKSTEMADMSRELAELVQFFN